MPSILDRLAKYKGPIRRAVLSEIAPGVIKGYLLEFLAREHMTVSKLTTYVESNKSLWSMVTPEYQTKIQNLAKGISINWLTPHWLIDSVRNDFPSLASLFMSDPDAARWLQDQVRIIREALTKR